MNNKKRFDLFYISSKNSGNALFIQVLFNTWPFNFKYATEEIISSLIITKFTLKNDKKNFDYNKSLLNTYKNIKEITIRNACNVNINDAKFKCKREKRFFN